MKTFLWTASLLLALAPMLPAAGISFRVSEVAPEAPEGPTRLRPFFEVGPRRISFRPPYQGRLSSSAEGLAIFLEEKGLTGEIHITSSEFAPSADFLARVDDYEKAGEGTLPKEADKLEALGGKGDLYPINQWKSFGWEWKYSQTARLTHREVAWLNLDAEHQVRITIVSDEDYWKVTSAVAKRFIMSWYWLADEAK